MDSIYYADDDRVEVIGDRGIILVNRCTARTLDLPPLMLFRDGKTTAVPVERFEWHDSFIDCTRHLIDVLAKGGQPRLDGPSGKAVLQFVLAAHISHGKGARSGRTKYADHVNNAFARNLPMRSGLLRLMGPLACPVRFSEYAVPVR